MINNSKPNFPEMEKKILDWWYKSGLVDKYLHKNDKSKKRFSFVDGPITANNPMGVHHAWGRTYKDLWQRYFNMKGFKERFQNGFDCQGLWVEVEVEKELGFKNKKDIENYGIAKFVEKCKERVRKYAAMQTEQSKRLGYFMDWDNSYYTMSDKNNYTIWYFLKVCWERGWVYKGHDVVPWCPRCETAISEHEILTEDYKEVTHESIYFKYPIVGKNDEFLLIWTTTPWTIPANIAVVVDKDLDYVLVEMGNDEKYWLAKKLMASVLGKEQKALETVKGQVLVGLKYRGPFDQLPAVKEVAEKYPEKFHTVIATDPFIMPVSEEEGTGLVHTSTGTGAEDFKLGQKMGLPVIPATEDDADYLPKFGFLAGKNAKKEPNLILDYLKTYQKGNFFFKTANYTHRYPVCWRCKTELIWKVADEWYIAMDKEDPTDKSKRSLRQQLKDLTPKITWLPQFGLDRELDWLTNMHDWLISKKNRYWGLALPIYECPKCHYFEVIGGKEELKTRTVEGYEEFVEHSPHRPWVDKVKIKCHHCGEKVSRIKDVGNPWLDAGIVSFSTITKENQGKPLYFSNRQEWREWFPADFITESFPGQFKNWFYSLLVMSTVLEKEIPFKTVLGFGTLLGENGKPMHKSNPKTFVSFDDGADKIGVDVLRWLYATSDPAKNLLFGYKVADEVRRKFHLMLWNIFNFYLTYAGLNKVTKLKSLKFKSKNILDKWINLRLEQTVAEVTKSLDNFDAYTASTEIEKFVSDLSLWYIRRNRDRVAISNEDTKDKTTCLATLKEILLTLSKLLAPFTPFLAEEMYQTLMSTNPTQLSVEDYKLNNSVHLSDWPETDNSKQITDNNKLLTDMELIRKICELGHSKRKELGIKVRQPLNKFLIFNLKFLMNEELLQLIKDELNVKQVKIESGEGETSVEFDTVITPKLKAKGEARDLVRQIQQARKEAGCGLAEKVKVTLADWPKNYTDYIKKETLTEELVRGDKLEVVRNKNNKQKLYANESSTKN